MRLPGFLKSGLLKVYRLFHNPPGEYLFHLRYRYFDELHVELNGSRLNFFTGDPIARRWFFPRYRDGSVHEPPVTRKIREELREDDTFFDIGANLGFFTVLGQVTCTEGRIHSFELDPELIGLIKKSVELNEGGEVVINGLAVTNESGDLAKFAAVQSGNKSTNSIFSDEGSVQIPTFSIDDYCKNSEVSPEVVKIDVEGAERLVLEGMEKTITRPTLRSIFLEVHPGLIPNSVEDTLGYMSNLLTENDFELYAFSDRRDKEIKAEEGLVSLESLSDLEQNGMVLCKR